MREEVSVEISVIFSRKKLFRFTIFSNLVPRKSFLLIAVFIELLVLFCPHIAKPLSVICNILQTVQKMKYNYFTDSNFRNQNNEKKETSNLKTIILTSLITASLTSLSQFFLQKTQLTAEQEYWEKRYNIESIKSLNDTRYKLIEELSNEILQLEVQAKEIKIQSAVLKYSKDSKHLEEMKELVQKYHKDLYRTASKMEIASIYFGNDVDNKLMKLSNALTENYKNNYVDFDSSNIDLPEFNLDFETIKKLPKAKKETFEAMLNNMNIDFEKTTNK